MVIVYIFDFILQRREVWIKPQNLGSLNEMQIN